MIIKGSLRSSRLRLETLDPDNLSGSYLSWLHDPEVTRFLEVRHAPSRDMAELEEFVRQLNTSPRDILLGVFDQTSNLHLGNVKLGPVDFFNRRAVIGLLIGEKDQWGRGLGSEIISRVFDFAVEEYDVTRVEAGCYSSNLGSKRAFMRAGFHVEARLRDYWWHEETGWNDELILVRFASQGLPQPGSR